MTRPRQSMTGSEPRKGVLMNGVCFVTGGAGFIGCAIADRLVEVFSRVVAIDNLHPQIHKDGQRPEALHPSVELVEADIAQRSTWANLLRHSQPDVIVHLAAETGTGQSLTEATRHATVNVVGTSQMLDVLTEFGALPRKIVLTSSRAIYGEGAWRAGDEPSVVYPGQRSSAQLERSEWDFPGLTPIPAQATKNSPQPTSVYGATKLAQEHILRSWSLSFGVELGVLRLQNVYGPGQSLINSYTGIVALFARLAREGQSIPVYEDGNIVRDFVFIDDVAAAINRLVTGTIPSPAAYDIGSGNITTIYDLAMQVANLYKAPDPQINGKFRNGDVRFAACDITRSIAELGWRPRSSLADGIAALCKWIDSQSSH